MIFRRHAIPRWALWVCVAALILRAAMPLLASVSAEAQGRTMVEVCSVYGVSLVPLDGATHDHAPEPMTGHAGEHCALSALAALAAPTLLPELATLSLPRWTTGPPCARSTRPAHDANATWVARLKHGPPDHA